MCQSLNKNEANSDKWLIYFVVFTTYNYALSRKDNSSVIFVLVFNQWRRTSEIHRPKIITTQSNI